MIVVNENQVALFRTRSDGTFVVRLVEHLNALRSESHPVFDERSVSGSVERFRMFGLRTERDLAAAIEAVELYGADPQAPDIRSDMENDGVAPSYKARLLQQAALSRFAK